MPGRDDAGQRGGQLRSQRHLAFAFVREMEQLTDDFVAALFAIQVGALQRGSFPFHETSPRSRPPPSGKNIVAHRTLARCQITKSRK